jgi:hypothetical protein
MDLIFNQFIEDILEIYARRYLFEYFINKTDYFFQNPFFGELLIWFI